MKKQYIRQVRKDLHIPRGNLPTGLRSSSASIPPRAGGETG